MKASYEMKHWVQGTDGLVYIETTCVGSCEMPYRIDECHPEFKKVKAALDAGDRSIVFCYHKVRR